MKEEAMESDDPTSGLPDDLKRVLRDQSVIVPKDAAVFALVAGPNDDLLKKIIEWRNAPSNTMSAAPRPDHYTGTTLAHEKLGGAGTQPGSEEDGRSTPAAGPSDEAGLNPRCSGGSTPPTAAHSPLAHEKRCPDCGSPDPKMAFDVLRPEKPIQPATWEDSLGMTNWLCANPFHEDG